MGGHAGTSPSPSSGPAESPLGKDPAPEAPAARWEAPDVGTRVPRLLQSPGWCEAVPGTGTLTLPHRAVPPSEGQRAETSSSRGTPSLSAGCLIRASPQAAALRESRDNSIPSIGTHCSSCPRLGSQGSGLACPAPQELPALLGAKGEVYSGSGGAGSEANSDGKFTVPADMEKGPGCHSECSRGVLS